MEENSSMAAQLARWVQDARCASAEGRTADYIPELAKTPSDLFGAAVHTIAGESLRAGDAEVRFTMQSISKVFTLMLALMDRGEERLFERVGMEPTGDNFNSMVKLELVQPGRPFNPMINAGAITVTSMIHGTTPEDKIERILQLVRDTAGDQSIGLNERVYESEAATADRNRSLAYFLKHNKMIEGDVEEHLQVYFKHCAIEVHCGHLARMALIVANRGADPETGRQVLPERVVQIAKVFMTTCGMYNASGEFAIEVGVPAKSGVAGGILAVVPGRMGIGVFGPALSEQGNSVSGVRLLQRLSREWGLHMF